VIDVVTRQGERSRRILGHVPKRLLVPALGVALALSVLAFLTISPVLAAAVLIGSLTVVAVGGLAADWEKHPTFEDREKARSRRRQEKWERSADARAKDRARFEAYQQGRARKAAREQGS
jgi:hypothetical protein